MNSPASKPVWVEAESKKVGRVQLPDALLHAMGNGQSYEVGASMQERVRLLREEYPHLTCEPMQVVQRLAPLKPVVGAKELAEWSRLAAVSDIDGLVARLLKVHYDPSYARYNKLCREADKVIRIALPALSNEALACAADTLARQDLIGAACRDSSPQGN